MARHAIIESACERFVTLHDEPVSAGVRAGFANWFTESPVHVREYLIAEGVWWFLGQVFHDPEWVGEYRWQSVCERHGCASTERRERRPAVEVSPSVVRLVWQPLYALGSRYQG